MRAHPSLSAYNNDKCRCDDCREVMREYYRTYRDTRRVLGICIQCANTARGRDRCVVCSSRASETKRRQKAAIDADSLCQRCASQRAQSSTDNCSACWEQVTREAHDLLPYEGGA